MDRKGQSVIFRVLHDIKDYDYMGPTSMFVVNLSIAHVVQDILYHVTQRCNKRVQAW